MSEYGTGTYGGGGQGPPIYPPPPSAGRSPYDNLLTMTATIRHRTDTTDDAGDVITAETITGPYRCYAYQRYGFEEADGKVLGVDELVVHLPAGTVVEIGDRIDITGAHRTIEAEVIRPAANRVRAPAGQVHHVEVRTREIA